MQPELEKLLSTSSGDVELCRKGRCHLLMTTNEPDKVHLGQWVGQSQAHKEQAAKERGRVCCLGLQVLSLKE